MNEAASSFTVQSGMFLRELDPGTASFPDFGIDSNPSTKSFHSFACNCQTNASALIFFVYL